MSSRIIRFGNILINADHLVWAGITRAEPTAIILSFEFKSAHNNFTLTYTDRLTALSALDELYKLLTFKGLPSEKQNET